MSQMKIWKVVKDRRTKREERRTEEAKEREQRDSKAGKRVELRNSRDLAQWEAVYGDKTSRGIPTDSGLGTSVESFPKKSASVREREIDSIEMDDMAGLSAPRSTKDPRGTVMLRVAEDDEDPQETRELQLNPDDGDHSWWQDYRSSKSGRTKSNGASTSSIGQHDRPPVPGGPAIVSLPFSPPIERNEDAEVHDGSGASKAAAEKSVNERRGVPLNKLVLKGHDEQAPFSLPRIDDDRASSVAATATDNDRLSTHLLSTAPSPYQLEFPDEYKDQSRSTSAPQTPGEPAVDEMDDEELFRPTTSKEEPRSSATNNRRSVKQLRKSSSASDQRSLGSRRPGGGGEDDANESDGEVSVVHSLKGHLPESMSKVAMAYRTNEWAKHIAGADQPDHEEAQEPDEPGVRVDVGPPEEEPRRVNSDTLVDTGPPVEPAFVQRKPTKKPKNPYRRSQDAPVLSRQPSGGIATPVYASQASLQRQGSSISIQQSKRQTRNSATAPSQKALVESPLDEQLASSGPYRNFSTPLPTSTNLFDERNDRLKRKTTTTSFNALTSAPNANPVISSESASARDVHLNDPDSDNDNISLSERRQLLNEENMTLAERKSLMQQGAVQSNSPPREQQKRESRNRTSSTPTPGPPTLNRMPSASTKNLLYDSHQPKRSNTVDTVKQNAMLTQWRQSLQQNNYASKPNAVVEEQARQTMITQRRQSDYRKSKQQVERANRESQKEVAMRTGQMNNAHQDALRRMQAKANRASRGP